MVLWGQVKIWQPSAGLPKRRLGDGKGETRTRRRQWWRCREKLRRILTTVEATSWVGSLLPYWWIGWMWIVEPVSNLGSSTYPVLLPLRAWVSSVQCKVDQQLLMVIRESSKMEMRACPLRRPGLMASSMWTFSRPQL